MYKFQEENVSSPKNHPCKIHHLTFDANPQYYIGVNYEGFLKLYTYPIITASAHNKGD